MRGILAAIAAHRAAYDAFQVAVGDEASLEAEEAYDAASDALVATACASRADAGGMLAHLRWWIAEEAEFREAREPAYGAAELRIADLAPPLDLPETDGPDPVFAALAAVARARRQHLAALAGLDEDDEAQMRRANAAADAESVAFEELGRIIPTTLTGLRTLTERYAVEAEETERWASGAGYLRHVGRALRVIESGGPFPAPQEEEPQADQALAPLIPNALSGPVSGRATIIPGLPEIEAAWHGLPLTIRDRIGIIAVDMVFQAFVSGEAYEVGGHPESDFAVTDGALRDAAKIAEDERLTELHRFVETVLPDLFGATGENPMWCDNPGARPEAAA